MIRSVAADGRPDLGGVFTPIARPRVLERIATATRYRIAAIIAPAGFGKSVAVRQYLTIEPGAILYEVVREDAHLDAFVRGFVRAVSDDVPELAASLTSAIQRAVSSKNPGRDMGLWMRVHLQDLKALIVLEDIHYGDDDPEIAIFLTTLLEMSAGPRWLLSSRTSSGLPIASWLAYGEMDLTIDAVDLQFTFEETRESARSVRVAARDSELTEILALVEGWPMAVSFALRSSMRAADFRAVSVSTREMAYRYLAEQVYAGLDAKTRDFLSFASLLPRLELRFAEAAGYDRAQSIIAELRERFVFISAIDATSFRLHDLFRDFVRHQLELEGRERYRDALRRVGRVLETCGETSSALGCFINAVALDDMRRILVTNGLHFVDTGRADIVERALATIGKRHVADEPAFLGLRGAIEHYHGRPENAARLYQKALVAETLPHNRRTIGIRFAGILVDTQGEAIVPLLDELLADRDIDSSQRASLLSMLAVHQAMSDQTTDAATTIESALEINDYDDDEVRARLFGRACGIAMLQKRHDRVRTFGNEAIAIAVRANNFSIASRTYQLMCANLFWSTSDRDLADEYARLGTQFAMKAGDMVSWINGISFQMYLCCETGDIERFDRLDAEYTKLFANASPIANAGQQLARAERAAWSGDFASAHQIVLGISTSEQLRQAVFVRSARLAAYFALDGRDSDAKNALSTAERLHAGLQQGNPTEYDSWNIGTRTLALVNLLVGRKTAAIRRMRNATPDSDALRGMDTALRGLIEENEGLFASGLALMRAHGFGGYARIVSSAGDKISRDTTPLPEGLTAAELAVLHAMTLGLSNQAIADEQCRTVNTVRTHVSAILRKLNVSTRGEAVASARARNIIHT